MFSEDHRLEQSVAIETREEVVTQSLEIFRKLFWLLWFFCELVIVF